MSELYLRKNAHNAIAIHCFGFLATYWPVWSLGDHGIAIPTRSVSEDLRGSILAYTSG